MGFIVSIRIILIIIYKYNIYIQISLTNKFFIKK